MAKKRRKSRKSGARHTGHRCRHTSGKKKGKFKKC